MSLSAAADTDIYVVGTFVVPATGPELTTTDVDPNWLKTFGIDPSPSRPLSTVSAIWLEQRLAAGSVAADAVLPTLAHNPSEPDKHVQVHLTSYPDGLGLDTTLTGTVTGQ